MSDFQLNKRCSKHFHLPSSRPRNGQKDSSYIENLHYADVKTNKAPVALAIAAVEEGTYDTNDQEIGADRDE